MPRRGKQKPPGKWVAPLTPDEVAASWEAAHDEPYPHVTLHVWLRRDMKPSERRRYNYGGDLVASFLRIDDTSDWMVSGAVVHVAGRLALERVTVEPNLSRNPDVVPLMKTSALRSIKLDGLLAEVKRAILDEPTKVEWTIRNFPELNPARVARRALKDAKAAAESVAPASATGRGRKRSDLFLWQLARDYLELRDSGASAVNAALRKRHAVHGVELSAETMRDWLKACERAGFLTAGHRGRASREAGPKFEEGAARYQEADDGS